MAFPSKQAELMADLSDFFYKNNFMLIPDYQQFRRRFEGGFEAVVFAFSEYAEETLGEVFLGVRLEIVESLMLQFSAYFSDYKPQSPTLLVSLGNLQGKKHFRLRLGSAENLKTQKAYLRDFMQDKGFEFLENCQNLEYLEKLFNQNAEQAHPYFPNHYHRALRGLVLTKLKKPSQIEDLHQKYQQLLDTWSPVPQHKQKLSKLANFLQQFSFN